MKEVLKEIEGGKFFLTNFLHMFIGALNSADGIDLATTTLYVEAIFIFLASRGPHAALEGDRVFDPIPHARASIPFQCVLFLSESSPNLSTFLIC